MAQCQVCDARVTKEQQWVRQHKQRVRLLACQGCGEDRIENIFRRSKIK
jgi:hypothetical protein